MSHQLPVFDSITLIGPEWRGRSVLAASHAGVYVAQVGLDLALGGVILNDAGVGREQAGIGGLARFDMHEIPAATISTHSARIGDGSDHLARGRLSFVNATALGLGLAVGMPAEAALRLLLADLRHPKGTVTPMDERRQVLKWSDRVDVVILDSNSQVLAKDAGHIVVTGSHGGLLGGQPQSAVKWPVMAAVYNDAAIGIDGAGTRRLPALDARGIPAATVSAWSARIGDGGSTFDHGFISYANACAREHGIEIGISCREAVARLVETKVKFAARDHR